MLEDYEIYLKWMIDIKSRDIYEMCKLLVKDFGEEGGLIAYNTLLESLVDIDEKYEEVILDTLDALSGQCNRKCWIGTGDYHLN